MVRALAIPGLLSGLLLLFWLWALIDAIVTDSLLIRNMQKGTWIFIIVFVPTIGAAAWLLFGRPEGASMVPGGQVTYERNPYRSERALGPEDTPGWKKPKSKPVPPASVADADSLAVRERKLMEYEAELAKREADLTAREAAGEDDAVARQTETDPSVGDDGQTANEDPDRPAD